MVCTYRNSNSSGIPLLIAYITLQLLHNTQKLESYLATGLSDRPGVMKQHI